MTMCPYKWFLYLASMWMVAYAMIEAFMQYRAANEQLQKPGFEPVLNESDRNEEEDDTDGEMETPIFDASIRRKDAALQR